MSEAVFNNLTAGTEPSFEATIIIGNIDFSQGWDDKALYKNPNSVLEIFTDYKVRNRYEKDMHRYMMPVCSPGGFGGNSVAFVQLAAPTLLWIADWTAARYKTAPVMPDPNVQDSNWILLDEHYEPVAVVTPPDGKTPLYRISGTYVYGHKNPNSKTIRNVNFARTPEYQDAFERVIPDTLFEQNIINKVGGSQGGGPNDGQGGPPNV